MGNTPSISPRRSPWADVVARAAQQALSESLITHPRLREMMDDEGREQLIESSYAALHHEVLQRRNLMAQTMGVTTRTAQTYFDTDFPHVLAEQATQEIIDAAQFAAEMSTTAVHVPVGEIFDTTAVLSDTTNALIASGQIAVARRILSCLTSLHSSFSCSTGHAFEDDNLVIFDEGDTVFPLMMIQVSELFLLHSILHIAQQAMEGTTHAELDAQHKENLIDSITSAKEFIAEVLKQANMLGPPSVEH